MNFKKKKNHEKFGIFIISLNNYLNTENTRAILPIARILFLMTSLRKLAALPMYRKWGESIEYTVICDN